MVSHPFYNHRFNFPTKYLTYHECVYPAPPLAYSIHLWCQARDPPNSLCSQGSCGVKGKQSFVGEDVNVVDLQ